jgi:hypothetical protein
MRPAVPCGMLLALLLTAPARASDGMFTDGLMLSLHTDGVMAAHGDAGGLAIAASLPAAEPVGAPQPCAPARPARRSAGTAGSAQVPMTWRDRLIVVAQQGAGGSDGNLDWAGLGLGMGSWPLGGITMEAHPAGASPAAGQGRAPAVVDCPWVLADALGLMALRATPRAPRAASGFSAGTPPVWRWAVRRHGVRVALLDGHGGHLGLDLSVRRRDDLQGGERRETRVMLRWRVAF